MEFTAISLDEVQASAIEALGLDPKLHVLEYPESQAASIRRAASFLCPTTPRALIDAVVDVLTPVLEVPPKRDDLLELLEQLISTGDLLELTESGPDHKTRLLYLGPPSFVERAPGQFLVTGIRPLAAPLVSIFEVAHVLHTRTVTLDPRTGEQQLRAAGLQKMSQGQWIGIPATKSPADFVEQYRLRLSAAHAAGRVDGLEIIDPARAPAYYRGRWRQPAAGDTGDFVGRRPQLYGADLWCVVRLNDGEPERLVDLPLDSASNPARDDAWRLQAAIDAITGTALDFRLRAIPDASPIASVVDFFSPLPTWAERYLELVGTAIDKSRGALFSYRVEDAALGALRTMLSDALWMNVVND